MVFGSAAQEVERKQLAFVLVELRTELPQLGLPQNGKRPDAALAALFAELPVVHKAVEPQAGGGFVVGLLVQVRQADGAAAKAGPGEHVGCLLYTSRCV